MEKWIAITGFEGLYEVSNLGGIRSLDREVGHRWGGIAIKKGKVIQPFVDQSGYLIVSLARNGKKVDRKVHRLVGQHFLPESGKPDINHKDLNKSNNNPANLEWMTKQENNAHYWASI